MFFAKMSQVICFLGQFGMDEAEKLMLIGLAQDIRYGQYSAASVCGSLLQLLLLVLFDLLNHQVLCIVKPLFAIYASLARSFWSSSCILHIT